MYKRQLRNRFVINRLSQQVEHTTQASLSNRYGNGAASIQSLGSSYQTVRRIHGNAAYYIVSDLLSNFGNELCAIIVDLNGDVYKRQVRILAERFSYIGCFSLCMKNSPQ